MKKLIILALLQITLSAQAKEVYATLSVFAEQTAELAFTYNGIINEIMVDITSVVKKGDVLATLKNDDLMASNKITQVSLKYAQMDLERYTKLKAKNLIDKSQLDKYKQAVETIQAQLKFEKAILDKTILKAPFDGVITQRFIELGDVVSGQMIKIVFTMQSNRNRTLVVSFDQKYGQDVNAGDKFIYTVDGDETKHESTVFRIYPAANNQNRKISLQVRAKDHRVGLFGEGIIHSSGKDMMPQTNSETHVNQMGNDDLIEIIEPTKN